MQRASYWNSTGQDAADFVVANGDAAQAHALVSSRGRTRTPVWAKSYNALVGLYFAERTPEVNGAFLSALGDNTIAERLAKPVDRAQQLAGNIWFYYGSRYGEYAGMTRQGNPEDFLPAMLEQSPGSASGYLTVADYYLDSGDTARAIADYEHTLELAPGRADVHDRLAMAYYKQGARAEAIAQWKQVFSTLGQQVNSQRVPESFWADFSRTCENLRSRKALQRFETRRGRASARIPPPQRQLPLERAAAQRLCCDARTRRPPPTGCSIWPRPRTIPLPSLPMSWRLHGFRWRSARPSISASCRPSRTQYRRRKGCRKKARNRFCAPGRCDG